MKHKPKQTFFDAFKLPVGSCRGVCNCGKTYYNSNGGWGFDDTEIEQLKVMGAIDLDYSVGFIELEGRTYIYDCECWHERAIQIQSFIDGHNHQIANYLNGEAKAIKEAANIAPTVGIR